MTNNNKIDYFSFWVKILCLCMNITLFYNYFSLPKYMLKAHVVEALYSLAQSFAYITSKQ